MLRVGTAGWNVPRAHTALCGAQGTHLERYACTLRCAEINSSFYRPHQAKTWARWAAATPDDFQFAVKAPKAATHTAGLVNTGGVLAEFFAQVAGLGEKLGPVLFQLPPKLAFDEGVAHEFFATVRELYSGRAVLEPRHESWFSAPVARLLRDFQVARVAADPPKGSPLAAHPAGWGGLQYFRWHGSPRTYWSEYTPEQLAGLAAQIRKAQSPETWVIFDNTAMGHGLANAVELQKQLAATPGGRKPKPRSRSKTSAETPA